MRSNYANAADFMMYASTEEIVADYFAELDAAEEAHMVSTAKVREVEYAEFPMGEFPPWLAC